MYIVFEGIVGSGKTTQVKKLGEYFRANPPRPLSQEGIPPEVLIIREPGSTPIAEDIRYLAQGKIWEWETMHPLTNAYLFAAARAQTIETVIKPALKMGKIVISDRSFLSSCAIQWVAQWLGVERVLAINTEALDSTLPDLVFYLEIDIDLALSRTSDRGGDKFEWEGKAFYEKITEGYNMCEQLEIMRNRFIRIDANGSADEVFEKILEKLNI